MRKEPLQFFQRGTFPAGKPLDANASSAGKPLDANDFFSGKALGAGRWLLHFPDAEADHALAVGSEEWLTDENGIVEPGVGAILWGFELRSGAEVELGIALFVLACADKATVTDVDVHTVIGTDAIDGFHFGAAMCLILQLVICSAWEDGALELRAFEGSAHDGDDHTVAMRGLSYRVGAFTLYFEIHDMLQLRSVLLGLCRQGTRGEHECREKSVDFFH